MSSNAEKRTFIETLQAYSIPLIIGVVVAVVLANVIGEDVYHHFWDQKLFDLPLFGLSFTVTPHWLVNDIFMVFFFGIAAKEITDAMGPGGALNPPSKAINPLMGTIGGVVGPVAVYFLLTYAIGGDDSAQIARGWGIPTATDIALAWLCARIVFGSSHPAVNFLLLLAVADDALGLGIIAIFYGNPEAQVIRPLLILIPAAMGVAYGMRKAKIENWALYIFIPGVICWLGLLTNGLHPALALVPIVPFIPSAFANKNKVGSPLENYEHTTKLPVDIGMMFFGLANAGVAVGAPEPVTFVVLGALIVGKTLGIGGFAWLGNKLGAKYPTGMSARHVFTVGLVGALGLTVALFVSGEAFRGADVRHLQSGAKLGALLSVVAAGLAIIMGKILKVKELDK